MVISSDADVVQTGKSLVVLKVDVRIQVSVLGENSPDLMIVIHLDGLDQEVVILLFPIPPGLPFLVASLLQFIDLVLSYI